MNDSSKRLLRELLDEREIVRTLTIYGHSLDYGEEDAFMDCWLDDGALVWPISGVHKGRAAILKAFRAHTHAPTVYHKHFMVEPLIRMNGDRAHVDSMFARLDLYDDGPQISTFGRYRDVLVRCLDGRWRFQERVAELEARHGQKSTSKLASV